MSNYLPEKSIGSNSSGELVKCSPYLRELKLDKWFAPVAEHLTITYDIQGLSAANVMLEVKSATYSSDPIYTRALSSGERTDGDGKTITTWDGTLTNDCPAGELRVAGCISPLHSPYVVRLYVPDTKYATKASFQVLYEHLVLKRAPWCPGDAPDRGENLNTWARYRLNLLGFFGGPLDADLDGYQKNAVIRYKMARHDLYKVKFDGYDATVTEEMADLLAGTSVKRVAYGVTEPGGDPTEMPTDQVLTAFPSREWPKSRGRKFTIWNHVSPTFGDELNILSRAELQNDSLPELTAVMRGRLNRPLLPIEVEIHVRTKDPETLSVFSPQAVGPIRVKWSHLEPWEDLTKQYADRNTNKSYPRKYIAKCLKEEGGQNISRLNNNCPEKYGGTRPNDIDTDNGLFLAYLGALQKDEWIVPYYYTLAYTGTDYPNRVGKASVYFRPSKIAGDRYEIHASLDFRGRENRFALEDAHAPLPIMTQSFLIENRRRASFGTVVQWPERKARRVNILDLSTMAYLSVPIDIPPWDVGMGNRLKAEFSAAFIDLDSNMAFVHADAVLNNEEFVELIGDAADLKIFQDITLRRQGLLRYHKDLNHKELIQNTLCAGQAWGAIQSKLAELIVTKVRIKGRDPSDFILVDLLVVEPADIKGKVSGEAREIRQFTVLDGSEGMGNGLAFIGQAYHAPAAFYSIAHEIGHCLWLRHWENSNRSFGKDHDSSDHSCIMSYPIVGDKFFGPDVYDPHFCGKCNLKLRGWDVKTLPANSD
jgi:hypothetical protein